jgi:hypothetical protein
MRRCAAETDALWSAFEFDQNTPAAWDIGAWRHPGDDARSQITHPGPVGTRALRGAEGPWRWFARTLRAASRGWEFQAPFPARRPMTPGYVKPGGEGIRPHTGANSGRTLVPIEPA